MCELSHFSRLWLLATLWTIVCPWGSSVHGILQARTLEWIAGPPPGIFPTQRLNSRLLHLLRWQVGSLPLAPPGKPCVPSTRQKLLDSCVRGKSAIYGSAGASSPAQWLYAEEWGTSSIRVKLERTVYHSFREGYYDCAVESRHQPLPGWEAVVDLVH